MSTKHCYCCGHNINNLNTAMSYDDLNWAHHSCLFACPRPLLDMTSAEIQEDISTSTLLTIELGDAVLKVINPETEEYCYIFWDEAGLATGPYVSEAKARAAVSEYVKQL